MPCPTDPVPAAALRLSASGSSPSSSSLPNPPPWTHSCRIVLADEEATVHCWPNPGAPDLPPILPAWVGRELQNALLNSAPPPPPSPKPPLLNTSRRARLSDHEGYAHRRALSSAGDGKPGERRNAAATDVLMPYSGVDLRLRTYPEEMLRAAEKELQQSSTWDAMPIPDMGITFREVPHLRIVDSIIRGGSWSSRVALQPLGPLLQCAGCPFLTLENVSVSGISAPYYYMFDDKQWISDPDFPVYGPIHASGLIGAEVSNFTCRDITYGQGWSCLLLQYEDKAMVDSGKDDDFDGDDDTDVGLSDDVPPELQQLYDTAAGEGFLTIRDSSISSTESGWGGAYGTSVLFSDELYGDYDFNTGIGPNPIKRYMGYGAVVVTRLAPGAAQSPNAYKASPVQKARGLLEIRVYDSTFKFNYGNFGGLLSLVGSTRVRETPQRGRSSCITRKERHANASKSSTFAGGMQYVMTMLLVIEL